MKNRTISALAALAIFTGSLLPPVSAQADDAPADSRKAPAPASEQLQQDLEARVQKDANAMAADAMTAAGDFDLPLEIERTSPRALVLVSDL